jgi:hypothetical protein
MMLLSSCLIACPARMASDELGIDVDADAVGVRPDGQSPVA